MAISIAKELIKQGYVTPKEDEQQLNFNGIKRKDIASNKDITFLYTNINQENP